MPPDELRVPLLDFPMDSGYLRVYRDDSIEYEVYRNTEAMRQWMRDSIRLMQVELMKVLGE